MRRHLNQVSDSPPSSVGVVNMEEQHDNQNYKARCEALERQIAEMSAKFSQQLVESISKI